VAHKPNIPSHVEHDFLEMANDDHVGDGHNVQVEQHGSKMMGMDPHMHPMHAQRTEEVASRQKGTKRSSPVLDKGQSVAKRFMMNR